MTNPIKGFNKGKAVKYTVIFLIVVALLALTTVKVAGFYNKVKSAWPAIVFAYNNPEIVDPVRDQYDLEYNALKDSIVKRQSMIQTGETESPKE
jgi:uncharacterized ion transporter superfamily protein YfcC